MSACETSIGVDNGKALEYLNEVRDSRNLAKLAGPYGNEELMEYLMREMRKRFYRGRSDVAYLQEAVPGFLRASRGNYCPDGGQVRVPYPG